MIVNINRESTKTHIKDIQVGQAFVSGTYPNTVFIKLSDKKLLSINEDDGSVVEDTVSCITNTEDISIAEINEIDVTIQ